MSVGNETKSSADLRSAHNGTTDNLLPARDRATSISTDHPQGTSEATSFLSQDDQDFPAGREEQPTGDRATFVGQSIWRPLTLRRPYLSFVLVLTLILGSLVLFLTISSIRNNGLGNDSASSALLFGRRFSPTLLATVYGLFVASMLNDVRRTEIFARLSKPGGASAEKTLCFFNEIVVERPSRCVKQRHKKSRIVPCLHAVYFGIIGLSSIRRPSYTY